MISMLLHMLSRLCLWHLQLFVMIVEARLDIFMQFDETIVVSLSDGCGAGLAPIGRLLRTLVTF